MYGHEYYGGNGIVGAQVSINTCIELTVHWGASYVWSLVHFQMLPSPPTLIFIVYMFILLLTVLEKTVINFCFLVVFSFRRANSLLFSYSSYSIDLFMNVVPTTLSCHFCSLKFLFHPDKIITRETLKQVTQPMTQPVHVPYARAQQSINYRTQAIGWCQ